jgi:hypothetical protein
MDRGLAVVVPGVVRSSLHYAITLVEFNLSVLELPGEATIEDEDVLHRVGLEESCASRLTPTSVTLCRASTGRPRMNVSG